MKLKDCSPVLVTGCAGFIGSHLTKRLLKEGVRVVGIDNLNDYYSRQLKQARLDELIGKQPKFEFIKLDLTNSSQLEKLFKKYSFKVVIHLAAQAGVRYSLENPYVYEKTNVLGTLNLLEMIKRHGQPYLVFSSTSSIYGLSKQIPFKETDPCNQPVSLYAATKKADEMMIKTYNHIFGLKTVILRFFTVYGPWGRPDMAAYHFTRDILDGKQIKQYGKNTSRDFTYVDDIVEAITRAMVKRFDYEIINLGNSHPERLDRFIGLIEKYSKTKAKIKLTSLPTADVPATYANIDKAKKLLGWQPKITLDKGLKILMEWYLSLTKKQQKDWFYSGKWSD